MFVAFLPLHFLYCCALLDFCFASRTIHISNLIWIQISLNFLKRFEMGNPLEFIKPLLGRSLGGPLSLFFSLPFSFPAQGPLQPAWLAHSRSNSWGVNPLFVPPCVPHLALPSTASWSRVVSHPVSRAAAASLWTHAQAIVSKESNPKQCFGS
jgi:hypothetical protein